MSYLIRDLPDNLKPRERFLECGVEMLTDEELLAIILRTGVKAKSVKELASDIIVASNGVTGLRNFGINNLSSIKGIGITKAITIASAIELGRRVYNIQYRYNALIKNSEHVYLLLKNDLEHELQEKMLVLYLNNKKRLIAAKTIFIGTINASVVHPREIFKEAIKESSSSIILVHNHPSGDPKPSMNDDVFTYQMREAAKLLDMPLLDHVIIGHGTYYSYSDVLWGED